MNIKNAFIAGIAAIAGFFSSAKQAIESLPQGVAADEEGDLQPALSTKRIDRKRNPAGTKMARKAAEGRLGLATLR